ncbi:GNAT family N-acetyltransferase [Pseudoruegeria sp. HB172150]|uniref:GNAT family N-acetyltransferase n=1 Tax=Pseudoruegeria sp. HB172150 TaxID=2721164 RepID=UPI001555F5F7|nr:GNAT family protein [Pseudoruegeria sp. HB172150]
MEDLSNWQPPRWPDGEVFEGRYARLELLTPDHAEALFAANAVDDAIWKYLPYGPFAEVDGYRAWVEKVVAEPDPRFHAIYDKEAGAWGGVASLMRINPAAGTIEVGHINYSRPLQRTRAATEAMFLLMEWAYEAGYRRYEWKCHGANMGSRRAAQRYGFSYEGVFRQAGVVKGRSRDTAWFASIDKEWPALKAAFETWLAPENFDGEGRQKQSLSSLTAPILVARDPKL